MSETQRRPRVLLADDYPLMHPALTFLLTPLCEVVGRVCDGGTLLEATMRLRPDVVVLDVRMPGIDGLDACRQIKAAAPDVHGIMFTASDDADLRVRALEVGASAGIALGLVHKWRWGRTVMRVAGSWVASIGVLMLGWSLRGTAW